MSSQVDLTLRSAAGLELTRSALDLIEQHKVWPTPLNIELFSHFVADPKSELSIEIRDLLEAGDPFTDRTGLRLAVSHFPEARLADHIRTTGTFLIKELEDVSQAINRAQDSNENYSGVLNETNDSLTKGAEPPKVKQLVQTLVGATEQVQAQTESLEKRLSESVNEVKRLQENLETLRRLVDTDALTKLANRKAFDDEIQQACAQADKSGQSLSVALIDIDHFKSFNDKWGHQTGDQVIRFVASTIKQFSPPPRLAARYGGEEFSIVFPNEGTAKIETVVNDLREEIANRKLRRRSSNDELGKITVSAGLAQRKLGETPEALIERADQALYASKRAGRNAVTNADAIPKKPVAKPSPKKP